MFELYIPYVIAFGLGMPLPETDPQSTTPDVAAEIIAPLPPKGAPTTGTNTAPTREPEPQVPTGQYTTAIEVKAILGMTKTNWAAIRLYEGQDLLYFSHLLAWRCGLWEIRYGINGAPADNLVEMEPCHIDTAQPNAITDPMAFPILVEFPPSSIESVYIEVVFDDGTTDFARFERNQILLP